MPVSKTQINAQLHVAVVLDRSSSMGCVRAETISGTNEQFSVLREDPRAKENLVSLFVFNENVGSVFLDQPADSLQDIGEGDYHPNGMTAMYDAVGEAIRHIRKGFKKGNSALVVVINDGMENASMHFDAGKISSQVTELQESGWTFTYIGANQDLAQVQKDLGIDVGNMISYQATNTGTLDMHQTVAGATRSYVSARNMAVDAGKESFSSNCLYTPEDHEKLNSDTTNLVGAPTSETTTDASGTSTTDTTDASGGISS
jgi:hypothetical protein